MYCSWSVGPVCRGGSMCGGFAPGYIPSTSVCPSQSRAGDGAFQRPPPAPGRFSTGPCRSGIHDLRDFLVRQAVQLAQGDGGAQLFRQRGDRVVHRLGDLLGRQLALGRVDVAQSGRILESFRLLAVELRRGRRPAAEGDQVILGRVDADAIKPCVESAVPAEIRQGAGIALMNASCATSSISDGSRMRAREQPLQLAVVLGDEQLEGVLVPRVVLFRTAPGRSPGRSFGLG